MTTLEAAEKGRRFRVVELRSEPETCRRLRELGFCEFAEVCKITHGGAHICQVCGTRVALSASLAEAIIVEPA